MQHAQFRIKELLKAKRKIFPITVFSAEVPSAASLLAEFDAGNKGRHGSL
jgi:hypothetical protein